MASQQDLIALSFAARFKTNFFFEKKHLGSNPTSRSTGGTWVPPALGVANVP